MTPILSTPFRLSKTQRVYKPLQQGEGGGEQIANILGSKKTEKMIRAVYKCSKFVKVMYCCNQIWHQCLVLLVKAGGLNQFC